MRVILGVDGGQTSLKCALADEGGAILGIGSGRGILHLAAPGGAPTLRAALSEAVSGAWASAGLPPRPVAAAALGLTGVSDAHTPEAELARQIAREVLGAEQVVVENDALVALIGAHLGQPGIIVIAGTGSIALGVNVRGQRARAGGWGWLLGDEGSAYWIGRQALRAALRAQEGWGAPTTLAGIFLQHFNLQELISVKRMVFSADFGAQGFAALAPLAAQAAREGDPTAAGIFDQAGQELGMLAQAVAQQLGSSLPVAPVGGAFEHFQALSQSFSSWLAAAQPPVKVISPRGSPLEGAVILARQVLSGEA